MSEHQNKFAPLDPGRVNSMDPLELHYWCEELHCTATELKDAVSRVGEHVTMVRQQLALRR